MTRLYLVRHGQVDVDGMFYGQLDVALSDRGRAQLQAAAEALARVELAAVYSSDLGRTVEGAEAIARPHGLQPTPNPAFREMNLGVLEGLPFFEAREQLPDLANRRYQDMWEYRFPEGGENLQDLADRINPALDDLLAQHPHDTVALVAHNSPNRVILGQALGLPLSAVFAFSQDFGCVNLIEYKDGDRTRARVRLINWRPGSPSVN